MTIPLRVLPLRVTVVRPAEAHDGYGDVSLDYGGAATRVTGVPAFIAMSLVNSDENTNAREVGIGSYTMLTTYDDLRVRDRIEHEGTTFDVVTPPARVRTLTGLTHHVEARLRAVTD